MQTPRPRRLGQGAKTPSRTGLILALMGGLLVTAACSTRPTTVVSQQPVPTAPSAVTQTGPGNYVGEVINAVGTPVDVRVMIGADLRTPVTPDAVAASTFLARSAAVLSLPKPEPRYLSVQIDNTGQVDAVPLPENIDVLDAEGRGANFRPAYELVRENQELLRPSGTTATAFAEAGAALAQRLQLREDLVRPGQVANVPYISNDSTASVAKVIINGSLARRAD